MTTIACSLNADDYRRRMLDLTALAREALQSTTSIDGGLRHAFADLPGIRERLEAVVAAEAECCSFLSLRLHRGERELVLDVTGPAEAQPVIHELFARDLRVPVVV